MRTQTYTTIISVSGLTINEECPGGFVECVDGFVPGSNRTISCEEACEGRCCVFGGGEEEGVTMPCDGFTGTICKDDTSCFGEGACYQANIEMIIRGCNGLNACWYAASSGGKIQRLVDGCNGMYACWYTASHGGSIESIVNSCLQEKACQWVAHGNNSSITDIVSSCDGRYSCYGAAFNGGNIAGISNSCNAEWACDGAGEGKDNENVSDNEIVSGINNCCNLANECGCTIARESYAPEECVGALKEANLPEDCGLMIAPTPMPTPDPTKIKTNGATRNAPILLFLTGVSFLFGYGIIR